MKNMVISHNKKYVFVELPRTGTPAISNELIENHDGKDILYDHAAYREFLKIATNEERKFYLFLYKKSY